MRQLASSIFDAAAAVAFIVGILVVALHPAVWTVAFVAAATIALIIRLAVERRHA